MVISEKNLKETIAFIVNQFRRSAKTVGNLEADYQDAKSQLAGISKLLIGRREHSYPQLALNDLKKIYEKYNSAKAA